MKGGFLGFGEKSNKIKENVVVKNNRLVMGDLNFYDPNNTASVDEIKIKDPDMKYTIAVKKEEKDALTKGALSSIVSKIKTDNYGTPSDQYDSECLFRLTEENLPILETAIVNSLNTANKSYIEKTQSLIDLKLNNIKSNVDELKELLTKISEGLTLNINENANLKATGNVIEDRKTVIGLENYITGIKSYVAPETWKIIDTASKKIKSSIDDYNDKKFVKKAANDDIFKNAIVNGAPEGTIYKKGQPTVKGTVQRADFTRGKIYVVPSGAANDKGQEYNAAQICTVPITSQSTKTE